MVKKRNEIVNKGVRRLISANITLILMTVIGALTNTLSTDHVWGALILLFGMILLYLTASMLVNDLLGDGGDDQW